MPNASCSSEHLNGDDCTPGIINEDLLMWWEPKADLAAVIGFNWNSIQQLKDAIAVFFSARIQAMATRTQLQLNSRRFNQVKQLLASNPQSAEDILDYLSITSAPEILVRVAENPACGQTTLRRLAGNESAEVRMACTENSRTPMGVLKALAGDENPDVRFRLAENAATPPAILRLLTDDDNPYVSNRARVTLERMAACHTASATGSGVPSTSSEAARELFREIEGICDVTFSRDKLIASAG